MYRTIQLCFVVSALLVLAAVTVNSFSFTVPAVGLHGHQHRFAGATASKPEFFQVARQRPGRLESLQARPLALANSLLNTNAQSSLSPVHGLFAARSGVQPLRTSPFDVQRNGVFGSSTNLLRTSTRPSQLSRNVWVGPRRGDEATEQDNAPERKMFRRLREKMSRNRSRTKSPKSMKNREQQAIMERERLREKLALRGKVSEDTKHVEVEVRSNIVKHTPRSRKAASPSQGRAVRPAFKHNHHRRSSSPSHVTDHPEWYNSRESSNGEELSMPRSLASFNNLGDLVNALEPVLASTTNISLEDAVGAMNRIRRLAKRGMDSGLYHRQAAVMKQLSGLVLQRMDRVQGKLLSLSVNAVAETKGNERWMEAASQRAQQLVSEGGPNGLDIQAVAVICNGFARAGVRDEALFAALSKEACRLAQEQPHAYGSQSVSVMVNAFAKLRISDRVLFKSMADVAMLIPPEEYSAQSVANILNAYARNDEMQEPLMVYMSAVMRSLQPEQYQTRHLSVSINAFAKLNILDHALLQYVQDAILERPPSAFDAQAIANILNGYGKLVGDAVDAELVKHMSTAIARTPPKYLDPTSLASILNALTKMNHWEPELWTKLASVARKLDPLLLDAQAVSTIMHSFAKADHFDQQMFDRMALTIGEMQYMLEAQSVALILNACAKVNYVNKPLVKHLSLVARQMPPESFTAQHVDNIVNSLARLGIKDRALFEHMAVVAQSLKPSDFDAQAVAVTMNAFAKNMVSERVSKTMFDFFSQRVLPELEAEDLSPTSVSVILNAYAKTEIRDTEVVHMLCNKICGSGPAALDKFDGRNIASVLHALATLHVEESETVSGLLQKLVKEDAQHLEPEEVAIIAWSTAVLNVHDKQAIDWLLDGLAVHLPNMADNFRRQAHQFVLSCELEGLAMGSEELWEKLQASKGQGTVTHSRLQKDVAAVLSDMGLEFLEEYVDERSGYSVDVLMSDKVTAIEVDGPSHYARGTHTPLGNTLMKHRHLSHLGFDVRILPYWEWDSLKNREQKKEYLRELLTSTPTMLFL